MCVWVRFQGVRSSEPLGVALKDAHGCPDACLVLRRVGCSGSGFGSGLEAFEHFVFHGEVDGFDEPPDEPLA